MYSHLPSIYGNLFVKESIFDCGIFSMWKMYLNQITVKWVNTDGKKNHQREKEYEYAQIKNENAKLSIEKLYYEILENQNQKLKNY